MPRRLPNHIPRNARSTAPLPRCAAHWLHAACAAEGQLGLECGATGAPALWLRLARRVRVQSLGRNGGQRAGAILHGVAPPTAIKDSHDFALPCMGLLAAPDAHHSRRELAQREGS